MFVLMGSFIENSLVTSKSGKDAAIEAFSSLADTICRYPDLAEHAKFILIPGMSELDVYFICSLCLHMCT